TRCSANDRDSALRSVADQPPRAALFVYETYKSCARCGAARGGDPAVRREDLFGRGDTRARRLRAPREGAPDPRAARIRPMGGGGRIDEEGSPLEEAGLVILVDTSVWIEFFRAQRPLDLGALVDFDEIATCLPVVQEVLQGFRDERAYRRAREA